MLDEQGDVARLDAGPVAQAEARLDAPDRLFVRGLNLDVPTQARQFVEFLQSAPAQETFKKYGFQDPPKR